MATSQVDTIGLIITFSLFTMLFIAVPLCIYCAYKKSPNRHHHHNSSVMPLPQPTIENYSPAPASPFGTRFSKPFSSAIISSEFDIMPCRLNAEEAMRAGQRWSIVQPAGAAPLATLDRSSGRREHRIKRGVQDTKKSCAFVIE